MGGVYLYVSVPILWDLLGSSVSVSKNSFPDLPGLPAKAVLNHTGHTEKTPAFLPEDPRNWLDLQGLFSDFGSSDLAGVEVT